jgi:hypothetical protein
VIIGLKQTWFDKPRIQKKRPGNEAPAVRSQYGSHHLGAGGRALQGSGSGDAAEAVKGNGNGEAVALVVGEEED